jgi:hypothetical protein
MRFVQWRPAFYVVGSLDNGIFLLDAFFKHLSDAMAKEKSFDVHITPHLGINLDSMWDDLVYENLGGPIIGQHIGTHPPRYPVDASGESSQGTTP